MLPDLRQGQDEERVKSNLEKLVAMDGRRAGTEQETAAAQAAGLGAATGRPERRDESLPLRGAA